MFENQATPEQAATLLAIGYLESKFTHGIDGAIDSNDKGLWQINPPRYFTGETPDNMTKAFFKQQGEELSINDFTKKVKYDIDYATQFAIHIVNYRDRNPKSYGPDPYDAWKPYTKYIKPNMKRLAPTDELILLDGLDAEITQAINYYKTYNEIPFGKPEDDLPPVRSSGGAKFLSNTLPIDDEDEPPVRSTLPMTANEFLESSIEQRERIENTSKLPMTANEFLESSIEQRERIENTGKFQTNSKRASQIGSTPVNSRSYDRVRQMLIAQANKQKDSAGQPRVEDVTPNIFTFNKALDIAFKLLGR